MHINAICNVERQIHLTEIDHKSGAHIQQANLQTSMIYFNTLLSLCIKTVKH
jgi:hypothetical protein